MNKPGYLFAVWAISLLSASIYVNHVNAAELYVGSTSVDITPPLPVALDGQFNTRVAYKADKPGTGNIPVLSAGVNKQNGSAATA